GTSARRGCSRVPTSPSPPSKTGLRWSASGQVSWLSDRPTPRAFPASRPVTLAGFVPDYSDGVAAASHRLPWALMGAPNAATERIRKELRGQYAPGIRCLLTGLLLMVAGIVLELWGAERFTDGAACPGHVIGSAVFMLTGGRGDWELGGRSQAPIGVKNEG